VCLLEAVDLSSTPRCPVTRVLPLSRPPHLSLKSATLAPFTTPQLSQESDQPTLKTLGPSVTPKLSLGSDQPAFKPLASPVIPQVSLKVDPPSLKPSMPLVIPCFSLGLDEPSPKPSASPLTPHLLLASGQSTPKIAALSLTPKLSMGSDCETGVKQSPLAVIGQQMMPLKPSTIEQASLKPRVVSVAPQLSLEERDEKIPCSRPSLVVPDAVDVGWKKHTEHASLSVPVIPPVVMSVSVAKQPTAAGPKDVPQIHIPNNLTIPRVHIPDDLSTRRASLDDKLSSETRTSRMGFAEDSLGSQHLSHPGDLSIKISRDPALVRDNLSTRQTDLHVSGVDCKGNVFEKLAAGSRSRLNSLPTGQSFHPDSSSVDIKSESTQLPVERSSWSVAESLLMYRTTLSEQSKAADKTSTTPVVSFSDNVGGEYALIQYKIRYKKMFIVCL